MALVGPNGAGKSTLLRVVAGLTRAASGDVFVDGRSLTADPWHVRRAIGLVGHHAMLHPDLTARENLTLFAHLYGLDRVEERAEAGLRQFGLERRGEAGVATLSRGMLQRLALARALLHDPTVLLLDEAETGLDARAHEWLISALGERGGSRTVIFASHDLADEAEVVFLRAGRVAGRVQIAGLGADDLRERYADALDRRPAEAAGRVVGVPG